MSAYIVSDSTINRIVSGLDYIYMTNRPYDGRYIDRELSRVGLSLGDTQNAEGEPINASERLGQALFALNVEAVEQRYGKGEAERFRPLDYKYEAEPANPLNIFQLVKSIQCLMYQCSEGNVPEIGLYKAMTEIAQRLAWDYFCSRPEYEKAEWA